MGYVSNSGLVFDGQSHSGDVGLIDIKRHLIMLWRRRWWVVASIASAVVLALAYISLTPSEYTAVATVLIDPRQEQVVDANSVLPNIGADSAAVTSQVNVLESRGLLEQVFASNNLASDPEFARSSTLGRLMASIQNRTPRVSPAAAFDEFRRRVKVQRIGLTYVLEIRFTSTDAAKAATLATAIVEEYLVGLARNKSDANLSVTRELDSRIQSLRTALSESELAVERFKVEHSMLAGSGSTTVMQSQIDQVTAQLSVAQEQSREANGRAEQARVALAGTDDAAGLDSLLVSDVGSQLRTQYNQRAAALLSMQSTMGPRHPSLRAAEAELEGMTAMIRAEAQRTLAQLEAEARLAEQNVASTQTQLSSLASDANETNRASVTLRQLERDAEVARSLLEEFMRRSLETSELGTMQRSEARVLSAATEPRSATWPKANLLLALAAGLGLALGCALALVLGNPVKAPVNADPVEPTPRSKPPGRAPSFARAGMAWTKIGSVSSRPTAGSIASIASHLLKQRAGRGSFFAGISTISSGQLQGRLIYDLADHYCARSVRTLVLDLNLDREEFRCRIGKVTVEVLSAFADGAVHTELGQADRPFVIADDCIAGKAIDTPTLMRIERWAAASGFDVILINMPLYQPTRWSGALASRLNAEVIVLRTEELLADRISAFSTYRADIRCPTACVTVPAVPTLISSGDAPTRLRQERAL